MLIDELVTYFEEYTTDIRQVVYVNQTDYENHKWSIRAEQRRLNHKPFSYKISVTSEETIETVIRVFFGPINENESSLGGNKDRLNFVEIDRFKTTLEKGENQIKRNSYELCFGKDYLNTSQLRQHRNDLYDDAQNLYANPAEIHYTFPHRSVFPK